MPSKTVELLENMTQLAYETSLLMMRLLFNVNRDLDDIIDCEKKSPIVVITSE